MNKEQMIEQFSKRLVHSYFKDCDYSTILSSMSKDFTWIGIENDQNYLDYEAFVAMLKKDNTLYEYYSLFDEQYTVIPLADNVYQTYCTIHLKKQNIQMDLPELMMHLTMVIKQHKDQYSLCSLHISNGNVNYQRKDEKLRFLHDATSIQLQEIIQKKANELEQSHKDIKQLTENLPGGIFRCLNDEKLTLTYMSNGFLSMIGYTREEVQNLLGNSLRLLIDTRDLEERNREIAKQLMISDSMSMEYRIVHKDGHSIWIMDKGQLLRDEDGTSSFYCIIVDTTVRKQAQDDLKMSLERHKIIIDQTDDIIFEWNIKEDQFLFSNNWRKKFGYDPLYTLTSSEICTKSHLHPDDAKKFYQLLMDVKKGIPYMEKEIRIQKTDGSYLWCNTRITTQFDECRKPISAVGVFIDIDSVKRTSEKLLEKAERDPLTNLYNKTTVQSLIEKSLTSNNNHAMMIIDIDNFKYINDSMGHLFGDAFLCEVASHIQENVDEHDIVGRIGGDEFIVFIKDITCAQDVEKRAEKILNVFHNIEIKEIAQQHISSSIGIAVYPRHGTDFFQLYRNADYTLYEAKKDGKNKFLICSDEILNEAKFSLSPASHSAINENIDFNADETKEFSIIMLTEYVFKILYQSMDIEVAISSIIDIVGKKFDVSRVYIFENSENDEYCSNTFEWCNNGIASEKDSLQNVSYKEGLGNTYTQHFHESDIFYCRDISTLPESQYNILAPQGIKSLLQCAIRDGKKLRGFVGFDECRDNRFWTQTQINSLSYIAALLSTFLLKERAQKRLEESAQGLQTILDNQNSWIYVVDKQTYTMHYINQKTVDFLSTATVGMKCYEAFFNKEEPCEQCPVRKYKEYHKSVGVEIYNPVLSVWSVSNAIEICWNGKSAYLVSSYDITKYKK